ncbi:MAG: methyltransferase domain-containing protein [Bradymonadaceae bacterium]
MNPTPREREPYGITYDRLRLDALFDDLIKRFDIKRVLEYPAEGSKAMPSIYSLALAARGCHVTLVNPEPQGVDVWRRLGFEDQMEIIEVDDLENSGLDPGQWDLAWNFVTLGFREDFQPILKEMARLSRRHVMTVHCNAYNWGYPWHHFLHRLFKLEWTHGQTDFFWPHKVRAAYRNAGARPLETGLLDMPWWPDPPGFRDIRLHLSGGDQVEKFAWTAPIEDYYRTGEVSAPLRLLEAIESGPVPRPVRWVFSHLFYVLTEVDEVER